ncbi:transposase [Micromonospora sp. 4G55]|nr:transposase [Micromonospora sp. 4G55]
MTTKIHLACDGAGRTLAFVLSGGNVNDCTRFTHVMAAIRVERPGPGRPRVRPDHVIADKGYSSRAIRADLRRRGIGHTIPERADQQANRRRRAAGAAGHQCSTSSSTSAATSSNAASTGSSSAAASPPATTRPPRRTRPPSPSPRYCNGCDPLKTGPSLIFNLCGVDGD